MPERTKISYQNLETAAAFIDRYKGIDSCPNDKNNFQEAIMRIRHNKLEEADSIFNTVISADNNLNYLISVFRPIISNDYRELKINPPTFTINDTIKYPIEINDGHIFAKAIINNQKYNFFIDNGYKTSKIFTSLKEKLNLKPLSYSKSNSDINGKLSTDTAFLLNSIKIANIEAQNLLVYSSKNIAFAKDCDGVIGMDVLSQFDVRIDFKNKEIALLKSNPKDKDTAYSYSWMHMPAYYAALCDSSEAKMVLDLGSNTTFLFPKVFNIFKIKKDVVETKSAKVSGVKSNTELSFEIVKNFCLNISGYNFNFSKLACNEALDISSPSFFFGILGNDLWVNGRIRLDYQNGVFQYEED
jgi:hypothetical protein